MQKSNKYKPIQTNNNTGDELRESQIKIDKANFIFVPLMCNVQAPSYFCLQHECPHLHWLPWEVPWIFVPLHVDVASSKIIVVACIITVSCSPIIGTIFSLNFGMTRRRSIFGWFHFHLFFFLWMVPTMPLPTRWVKGPKWLEVGWIA